LSLLRRWFADRRGETFPGLGPTSIRVAVRDAGTSDRFAAALADALARQFNI
jgi:histidinol-phosphate/aromatic aminotransferase/cobyric acid decarboxylase-like protein